ncbi:hypothetical protein V1264_002922 [Littorina saxatilis]|uniref:Uncharacterized protein n=1 Tax=Littorina saxatilis TaxID=31220 RepID=A0AAN9B4Z3_9CAEN
MGFVLSNILFCVFAGSMLNALSIGLPVTTNVNNQPHIPTEKLTSLLEILYVAKGKANSMFDSTCPEMTTRCQTRKEDALVTDDYPSFINPASDDVTLLTEIHTMTCTYCELTEALAESVKNQMFRPGSNVYTNISNVASRNLRSACTFVGQLINKDNCELTSPRYALSTVTDVRNRNARNIRVLARASHELKKMASGLLEVIEARG